MGPTRICRPETSGKHTQAVFPMLQSHAQDLKHAVVVVSSHGGSPGVGVANDRQRPRRLDDVPPLVEDLAV